MSLREVSDHAETSSAVLIVERCEPGEVAKQMRREGCAEQLKSKSVPIDEYLAENASSEIDLSRIHCWCADEDPLQGKQHSNDESRPAAIIEFDAAVPDCASEARAHALMQRIQEVYDDVYLIDHGDESLVAVENYAQFCCLMLAGGGVADLLCLGNPVDAAAVAEYVKRPTYNASHACTWRGTDAGLISFSGLYPDGWNHGNALGVVSGISEKVSIRARVAWWPGPDAAVENHIVASVGDDRTEIILRDETARDLEIELPGKGLAHLWSSATREASDIWSTPDPRVLGFCLSQIEVRIDR